MLIIRKAQMAVFDLETERVFHKRLFQFVRQNHLEQTQHYTDEELRSLIAGRVAEAEKYGMTTQSDIAEYIGLSFLLQDGIQSAQIRDILEDAEMPAGTKLLQLNHLHETRTTIK